MSGRKIAAGQFCAASPGKDTPVRSGARFLFREETCSRFGKGLDQPAILFPAIQKPGVQLALAFDLDGAALFHHEQIAQRLSNRIRHMHAPGQAIGFHPAGRIYGVSDGVSPFSLESME